MLNTMQIVSALYTASPVQIALLAVASFAIVSWGIVKLVRLN